MGHYEWHAMEISRLWGREPDWFFSQIDREQARLFAWYQMHISRAPYRDPRKELHDRESPVDVSLK